MEIATKQELSAIAETAAGRKEGPVASVPIEVTTQPGLALNQEWTDVPVRIHPAAAARRWHRDDHASVWVDDHAQTA